MQVLYSRHGWNISGEGHLICTVIFICEEQFFAVRSGNSICCLLYIQTWSRPLKRLFVTRKYNTFSDRLNIELGKITDNSMPTRASGDYQRYAEGKTEASRIFLLSKLTHHLVLKQLSFFFLFLFLYCLWYNFNVGQRIGEQRGGSMAETHGTEEAEGRQERISL